MLCAWGMAILGYIDGYMWGAGGEEEKKRYTSTSTTGINTRVIKLIGRRGHVPCREGRLRGTPRIAAAWWRPRRCGERGRSERGRGEEGEAMGGEAKEGEVREGCSRARWEGRNSGAPMAWAVGLNP